MARIDLKNKVIQAKLVYYGPGLCGKTTNLEWVNKHLNKGQELMSLSTEGDRTIFFDFMPLNLGKLRGMDVHFKLYTVPGQVRYNETRKMVLKNVDGIVFVADSQELMMDANLESLDNLFANLRELGVDERETTVVLQYNKRDLPGALPQRTLDAALNQRGYPTFLASARAGEGVAETLRETCALTLNRLVSQLPPARADSKEPALAPVRASGGAPGAAPVAAAPIAKAGSNGGSAAKSAVPPGPPPRKVVVPAPEPEEATDLKVTARGLLTEMESLLGSIREELAQLRSVAAAARERSAVQPVAEVVTRAQWEALSRRMEEISGMLKADARARELERLDKRAQADRLEHALGELGQAVKRVSASSSPALEPLKELVAGLAGKSDLAALTERVALMPTRADVDTLRTLSEEALDEISALGRKASEAVAPSPALETLRQLVADLASKSDLATLAERLTQSTSGADQQLEQVGVVLRSELGALESRLPNAKIAALSARVEQTATRDGLEELRVQLTGLAERVSDALASHQARFVSDPAPARVLTPSPSHATAPEAAEDTELGVTRARVSTQRSWPPRDRSSSEAAMIAFAPEAPGAEPAPPVGSVLAGEPNAAAAEAPQPSSASAHERPSRHPTALLPKPVDGGEPPNASAEGVPEPTAERHVPETAATDDPAHVHASRVARVMVADLYLYNKQAVEEGIRNDDFFERNKDALADMRATYESRVAEGIRDEVDHLDGAIQAFIEKKRKQLIPS